MVPMFIAIRQYWAFTYGWRTRTKDTNAGFTDLYLNVRADRPTIIRAIALVFCLRLRNVSLPIRGP